MNVLDLSHLNDALIAIVNTYPPGNHCEKCAQAMGQVLLNAGYDVALVTIQNEPVPELAGVRPPYIEARKPDGERFLLGQTGFHIACRISADQPYFYVDALVYLHFGAQAVEPSTYFSLFVYPDGIEITNVQVLG